MPCELPSVGISIHALREEGDLTCLHRSGAAHNFYPRPPRGGRRPCAHCSPLGGRISIHALREEGDEGRGGQFCSLDIFLSTPSARRATWHHRHVYGPQRISIHALREEGDGSSSKGNGKACKFLSTPSARRATSPIPTWRICDHKSGVFAIPRNTYIFKVVQYIMLCKTSKIRGN